MVKKSIFRGSKNVPKRAQKVMGYPKKFQTRDISYSRGHWSAAGTAVLWGFMRLDMGWGGDPVDPRVPVGSTEAQLHALCRSKWLKMSLKRLKMSLKCLKMTKMHVKCD